MPEPILLIGAGGFVGQHLLRACAASKRPVLAVSPRVLPESHEATCIPSGSLQTVEDHLPLLRQVRTVVHAASSTTPGRSAGRPLHELDSSLRPTLMLLEAMQSHPDLRLVYLSSGGALSPRSLVDLHDEHDAVFARSYHGAAKLAAEHFIEAWCHQFGGNAIVLRPSNLYGPGQPEREGFGVVPAAFGKLSRGELLHVWGNGSATRDFLYIDDFTELILRALDDTGTLGFQVFHACSGTSVDLNTLFALIERVGGKPLLRTHDAGRSVDAPAVRLTPRRANAQFGWTPRTGLAEGLERTWRWFSSFPR